MRTWVLAAGLAALFAALAPPAAAADSTLLGHQGRWIVDSQGRARILHGVGVMNYSPPNLPAAMGFGDKDAAFLAAHGFNLVRLGMNWSGIEPQPGVFDSGYLDSILATMRTLEAHGIYTLLDWHQDDWGLAAAGVDGAPAWATLTDGLPNPNLGYGFGMLGDPAQQRAFDNFWANKAGPGGIGITDRFATMLATYGRAFRAEPYLLGYDTFNEPNAGTQWPSCASSAGCPVFDSQLSAWFRRVLPSLRAADPQHLLWIEPNVFFDFAANTNLQDPNGSDPNTGFDFHTYCLGDGAANAAPPIPGNGPGCAVEETLNLNNATAYQKRTGVALLNSEWGATDDPQVVDRQTAEFDQYMLGDVFWDYNNLVPDIKGRPGGKNEDPALLAALDRPFPPIVAGTPQSWNWASANDTFTLHYATTLPDGRPGSGLDSEVYVPTLHYPDGYIASLSGAQLVSSNSTALEVRNQPNAAAVTVTVTPSTASGGSATVAPSPPAGKRCTNKRTLTVRLHLHHGERIASVSVRVDGRAKHGGYLAHARRHRGALQISLAGLRGGRHVIKVVFLIRRGERTRQVLVVRRYKLC
jgi:endoglycosylceramidase